jgi:putative two-component system response regulator
MKALLVDDNTTNLLILRRLLVSAIAIDVETFTLPIEALERLDATEFDIILVDYLMPEVDGIEFLRLVREHANHADVPVIMITAEADRDVRLRALESGASDFLRKPVDAIELRVRVRNLLKLHESQKLLRDQARHLQEEVNKAVEKLRTQEREIILRLSRATESRDAETGMHVLRIGRYCRLIAEALGLDAERCADIEWAAPMHDVGKLGVPDAILLKPGTFTPEERERMREHSEYGRRILAGSSSSLINLAAEIAWSHHERWDGTGYPRGLRGEETPLSGRITAVADTFDALVSARTYKEPWSVEKARAYLISESGKQFDPQCIEAFLSRWDDVLAICAAYEDTAAAANVAA